MANNANVSTEILSALEAGTALCKYDDFVKISYELGVPVMKFISEAESTDDLIRLTKSKGDELLEGLSKSEDLVKSLYRAKNVPKETMDQMATYIKFLLDQQGVTDDHDK